MNYTEKVLKEIEAIKEEEIKDTGPPVNEEVEISLGPASNFLKKLFVYRDRNLDLLLNEKGEPQGDYLAVCTLAQEMIRFEVYENFKIWSEWIRLGMNFQIIIPKPQISFDIDLRELIEGIFPGWHVSKDRFETNTPDKNLYVNFPNASRNN